MESDRLNLTSFKQRFMVISEADKPPAKCGNDRQWLVASSVLGSDPDSLIFAMQYITCLI